MNTQSTEYRKYRGHRERWLWWVVLWVLSVPAVAWAQPDTGNPWTRPAIVEARNAVEFAWEVYHHAALGGTLASPTIQSQLETELHQCRALLARAYAAAEQNDWKQVNTLKERIVRLSHHVVQASQEPKR